MNKQNLIVSEDKPHLGGNLSKIDTDTFSVSVWKFLIERCQIKTVMDVGSGLGFTSKWFIDHGFDVTSIEGLLENVNNAVVPTIEHDLTTSSYIKDNIDIVICIEVVEHIEESYIENLLETLCCGKFLLMTHAIPGQKGYHHVNCQPSEYWINHLKEKKFSLLEQESIHIRTLATQDGAKWIAQNGMLFQKI
jgi:hypothetical protein